MLLELEVSGFALVEHLVLEFDSGLTVLTGETGAGKSIILDSLCFLLGMGQKGAVEGQDCRVAGRFLPTPAVRDYLESQSLPVDEEELLIIRERRAGGRTTSRLNGSLVTAAQLKELSRLLVDLHGQHQSYALTRPSTHLPMLDRLAGAAQQEELTRYFQLYSELAALRAEMEEIRGAERHRLREIEWLRLEVEEIAKVAPRSGELELLESEIRRLAASDDLARGAHGAVAALRGEGGALDSLAGAVAMLAELPRFDPALAEPLERLRSAEIDVCELARELALYSDAVEHDPAMLDALVQRSEALKGLQRKYGPTLDDVLAHQKAALTALDKLEHADRHLDELAQRAADLERRIFASASLLGERRRKSASELKAHVVEELEQLAMASVRFEVEFELLDQPGPHGSEEAQFLFSPNPGRPPQPLAETASGGELSRVMLALISILSRFCKQPTLVFDEIDAGLGGRTAEAVAERLAALSRRVQVLCVTHLPVVAAAGSGHYVVEKVSEAESTTVRVKALKHDERVAEIARMLSGDASPRTARKLATDLLRSRRSAV
jgi:DNA repair protein RecN (Recombination protein N)